MVIMRKGFAKNSCPDSCTAFRFIVTILVKHKQVKGCYASMRLCAPYSS